MHRFLDIWVQVYGIDYFHVGICQRDFPECSTNTLDSPAEIFPPMTGDEDQTFARVQKVKPPGQLSLESAVLPYFPDHDEQRIDHRIAGDADRCGRNPFPQQMFAGALGRRKVMACDRSDQTSVHLFGPGGINFASAQPRFDVADGDLLVERSQTRRHRGGGVALDQHQVRPKFLEDGSKPLQHVAVTSVRLCPGFMMSRSYVGRISKSSRT